MKQHVITILAAHHDGQEPPGAQSSNLARYLSIAQGLYYAITGIWPLVSIGTFQKVTGPKVDLWLVKTVGVLVGVIGGVLASAGFRRQVPAEVALLAVGSAAGLAGIDVVYVARRRISRIYLLDAVAEAVLIACWALAWLRGKRAD